jgi:hypothetical protein
MKAARDTSTDMRTGGLGDQDVPGYRVYNQAKAHVMDIDKQRIADVRALESLGYSYRGGEWLPTATAPPLPITAEADAMRRADAARRHARRMRGRGYRRG